MKDDDNDKTLFAEMFRLMLCMIGGVIIVYVIFVLFTLIVASSVAT